MTDQHKQAEKIKQNIEKFKEKALEKFSDYIKGITLLPPKKEDGKDKINLLLMIDDTDSQKMSKEELKQKLTKVITDIATKVDKNLNPLILLNTEFVQDCYDNKHEFTALIAQSAIIYDTGMMEAIRVSELHKSMVLERFEKYIVSYVIGGSVITDKAKPDSDVDAFVIIDDTDVKKMTRVELRDKLRSIIAGMSIEARQKVGTKRDFHVQVYILTDFWDNIKDANPVIFTFVRDGLPLYDRGVFMPWKNLLKMGKIRPSPEAIDMLMTTGEQMLQRIEQKLKEIGLDDFFWATITSAQAAIMLYGLPPPVPNETAGLLRDIFVKKEKIFDDKHVKTFEKVMKIRKQIERGSKKTIKGKEIDELYKQSHEYLEAMKKLFEDLQLKKSKETIEKTSQDLDEVMQEAIQALGKEYKKKDAEKTLKELVKEKQLPSGIEKALKDFKKAEKDYKKGDITKKEIDKAIGNARIIIRELIESVQRKRTREVENAKIRIKHGKNIGELVLLEKQAILIKNIDKPEEVISINTKTYKTSEITATEADKLIKNENKLKRLTLNNKIYNKLQEIYDKNIELIIN